MNMSIEYFTLENIYDKQLASMTDYDKKLDCCIALHDLLNKGFNISDSRFLNPLHDAPLEEFIFQKILAQQKYNDTIKKNMLNAMKIGIWYLLDEMKDNTKIQGQFQKVTTQWNKCKNENVK